MNANQKMNLLFYLNKQRTKDGLTTLYLRIYVDGARAELSTPHRIDSKHWSKASMKMKTRDRHALLVNAYIDQVKSQINNHFLLAVASNTLITAKEIKSKYLGKDIKVVTQISLIEAIEYHNIKMKELVAVEQVVPKTLAKYETTKNKVVAFLKHKYRAKDKPLQELRLSFITEFEHYLLTAEKLNSNTASKYIKNIKKIMNMSVDLDWIPSNPFNKFKCTYRSPDRVVLSQNEIDRLVKKDFEIERLSEIRDVFVFCCYTGFAYSEVHKFKREDLTKGIDGELWLTTFRQKTGERESVPLLPIAYEVVQRYKSHPLCKKTNKLLPVKSNQVFNMYLKEIATLCGIKTHLTTHIARHTFATTIALSNGVPIETVSKMLGHSKLATTQIYAKVLDHKVSEDMQTLKAKLTASKEESKEIKKVVN